MGLRYQKRINLGLGFRVNISKSGIGYSWGMPGYRVTKKADGGIRKTYNIPGSGISYIEETSSINQNNIQQENLPKSNSMERYNMENSSFVEVKNGKIDAISSSENKLFISAIKKYKAINFLVWFISILVPSAISLLLQNILPEWGFLLLFYSLIGFSLLIAFFISKKSNVFIEYSIDESIQSQIKTRNHSFRVLSSCHKFWNIINYQNVFYSRVNAGANQNITRKKAHFRLAKLPIYMKTNNNQKFYQMKIANTKYIFLPDKILMLTLFNVGSLPYYDISIDIERTRFIETATIPKDSKFIEYTWQYVNNNGTPDRRFNNNRQLPVYEYATIYLSSSKGLNIHILVSSYDKATEFKKHFDSFDKIL